MAVIASFARSRGSVPSKHAFDLYVWQPASPGIDPKRADRGRARLAAMGRTYPAGYLDVDMGRWKKLTKARTT